MEKAVLTIATGKALYLELATTLARSFRVWHRDSDIRFVLATDMPGQIPRDLHWIDVVELRPGQYGHGFSPKLYLNEITPAAQTLFVDADCLCVGRLDGVFRRFAGRPVSVIGREISDGEWFGDVSAICRSFGVEAIPRFNGGVYYLEKGDASDAVFRKAQELQVEYDTIGFKRLRDAPNDEVLIALAMALQSQEPVADDGTIMNTTLAAPGGIDVDVFIGRSVFRNPANHPRHNAWYDMEIMTPVLAHFLGSETSQHPYRREAIRLERVMADGWPRPLATLYADLMFALPWRARQIAKNTLRPAYRRLFGVRPITKGAWDRD